MEQQPLSSVESDWVLTKAGGKSSTGAPGLWNKQGWLFPRNENDYDMQISFEAGCAFRAY